MKPLHRVEPFAPLETLPPTPLAAVAAIYAEAFPAWQRVPFESLYGKPELPAWALMSATDEPVAFAALHLLGGGDPLGPIGDPADRAYSRAPFAFLRYLAVRPARRGLGIGSRVFSRLAAILPDSAIVFEVDPPDDPALAPAEARVRAARVRFYERLGAVVLPVDYTMPAIVDGETPQCMLLLAAPPRDRPGGLPSVDAALAAAAEHYDR